MNEIFKDPKVIIGIVVAIAILAVTFFSTGSTEITGNANQVDNSKDVNVQDNSGSQSINVGQNNDQDQPTETSQESNQFNENTIEAIPATISGSYSH